MRKRVDLVEPIPEWFGKPVAALDLEEPRGRHLMFGEPRTWITNADGAVYSVENTSAIERYINELLRYADGSMIDGGAATLFARLSLADALQVKAALFDFFTEALRAPGSKPSKPSSSTSTP